MAEFRPFNKSFLLDSLWMWNISENWIMPRAWKRLLSYSKSGLNNLKIRCRTTSRDGSSENELRSESDKDAGRFQHDFDRSDHSSEQSERGSERRERGSEQADLQFERIERHCEREDSDRDCESSLDDSVVSQERNISNSGSELRSIIDDGSDEGSISSSSEDDVISVNDTINAAPQRNNEPLYEGAPLTVGESLIATLSMVVRHNMNVAMHSDLLRYAELHCPPENNCKTTMYKFIKQFKQSERPLIRHYYCTACFWIVDDQQSVCPSCEEHSKINYFLEASIIS